MDIEASARKHGVADDDMLHALRHHWRAFETDDPDVTMFVGPSSDAKPIEVGVVNDDCDHSRYVGPIQVPERLVDPMKTRAQRAIALEKWAEVVEAHELVEADTGALRTIAELVERRDDVDSALLDAIRTARRADRSWSEIGAMLGVSKQAAQRKYATKISA